MRGFKQATWPEPTIFEIGGKGRRGYSLPKLSEEETIRFNRIYRRT